MKQHSKGNTKLLLADSLEELLKTRRLSRITIQQIAENCGFSRQTFYANFSDKYALANWAYTYKLENILHNYVNKLDWEGVLEKMLEMHIENSDFVRALSKEDGPNSLSEYINQCGYEIYRCVLADKTDSQELNQLSIPMRVLSIGSGQVSIDWVRSGMREPTWQLARGFVDSMSPAIKKYF